MSNQDFQPRPSMVLDAVRPKEPMPSNRQDTFSRIEWMHEHPSQLPLVRRVPTLNRVVQSPEKAEIASAEKEMSTGKLRERVPASVSSSASSSSDDDCDADSPGDVNFPFYHDRVSASHMGPSDNTIHFSLDVADDIEGHLEEVSRLKRWGHFNEAIEYFAANLEHHLDLPLVILEYSDLLVEQGSYRQFESLVYSQRWLCDQKMKCLPIGSEESGPDLYSLHSNLMKLRATLPLESLSMDDLGLLQTNSFCEYLDKRAASRHGAYSPQGIGIPFDSTEVVLSRISGIYQDLHRNIADLQLQVQIIRNQLEIRSDIRCVGKTQVTAFHTRCWPELYNDLLMDGRIWELSDLLLAMFRFFGLSGTWERLFDLDEKKEGRGLRMIACLERLLKDWTIDEYDEATELAILTILVEMIYMLDIGSQSPSVLQKNRTLALERCTEQADQCAVDIKEYSPHLTKSRPYLQWILAKEHFDRQQNRSVSYCEQRKRRVEHVPGLVLNKWCLPIYIPVGTENAGWPAPDPKFPPSESLQWALRISQELCDYKTQAMIIKELICRVEDPRPLFRELDQLHGLAQGDRVALYDSCVSQYLLATDDTSCRELLQRLKAAASKFKPAPEGDISAATRWNGLMVQNALARSVSEDAELIEQNSETAQIISKCLPYSQKAIDKFAQLTMDVNQSANANENNNEPGDKGGDKEHSIQASPAKQEVNDLDLSSNAGIDSLKAIGESGRALNKGYEDEARRQLKRLELNELQQKREALEKELRDTKLRRELEIFEDEERLRLGKEEIRNKLRKEFPNSGPDSPNETPSRVLVASNNQKEGPTGEQEITNRDRVELKQPEDTLPQDTIPLTHEPDEIDYTHEDGRKEPQMPQKPHRYASVIEAQDEPTTFEQSGQPPANPSRSNDRSCQTPKAQNETAQATQTSNQTNQIVVEESASEENRTSSGESESMIEVWEEASSGASSPVLSSRRNSQESGDRQPRMIEYSEEVLD